MGGGASPASGYEFNKSNNNISPFAGAGSSLLAPQSMMPKYDEVRELFMELGSGYPLTVDQFVAGVRRGNQLEARDVFTKYDENKDGRMDLDEFRQVYGELKRLTRRRRMAQREFSTRRDSPVMTRLLEEIIAAQDN